MLAWGISVQPALRNSVRSNEMNILFSLSLAHLVCGWLFVYLHFQCHVCDQNNLHYRFHTETLLSFQFHQLKI